MVFKVCMEEFVKKGEEKIIYLFLKINLNQLQRLLMKNKCETGDDLVIISNTEDVVCKINTSQKYIYVMDKLYGAYLQKSLVDLAFIDIDGEIEKKLNSYHI